VRIGTRGSALALAQAGWVADRLGGEIVVLRTSGDDGATGDKSRWVDTIESALLAGEIDLAVHSAKDVPGELAEGCEIVATPPRAPAHDVLLVREGPGPSRTRVGAGGCHPLAPRVGTSSLRRRAQLLAWREDVEVVEVRGNVDTRLRKLAAGEVDALVLAAAGLERLGRAQGEPLPFVPAPGQGILAIEGRPGDRRADAVNDPETFACLAAERAAVRVLEADCHTPVGIHAAGGRMRAFVGAADGSAWIEDEIDSLMGEELGRRLLVAGAREIIG
jgi:hydroxymethylbilane synthase